MMFRRLALAIVALVLVLGSQAIAFNVVDPTYKFKDPKIADSGVFPFRGPDQCEIALLTNGEISFEARLQTLKNAKHSIRIQALIFTGDEAGRRIAEILIQKKKEGLDVRVIVDALSNPGWASQWMYYDLKQHGIEVEGYEAGYIFQALNELNSINPLIVNKRYHDKLWIIDGETDNRVAIVGGMNIAKEYFRMTNKAAKRWRDQDLAVRGAIIGDMMSAFDRNYDYFKDVKALRGPLNTDLWWRGWRYLTRWIGKLRLNYGRRSKLSMKMVKDAEIRAEKLELEFLPANARFIQSRPRFKETYIEQAYLDSIRSAEKEILIANAYFVPKQDLIDALIEAAHRGVKIKILTNSRETNDLPQLTAVSRYLYFDLLDANFDEATKASNGSIEIFEWQGHEHNEGTIHAKFAVFDRSLTIVGSYNLDPRSADLNSETVLAFENERAADKLASHFLEEDLRKSGSISAEQALEYRFPRGIFDRIALFMSLRLRPLF